jgi:hypothetical protein
MMPHVEGIKMQRKLLRVAQFCEQNPAFSQASMRWLIFNSAANGMDAAGVILRVDRRVLIDVERFHNWVCMRAGVAA